MHSTLGVNYKFAINSLFLFYFNKSAIYYMGRGGSLCLLGAGCEPTTLTTEEQGITNMAGGFTTMLSLIASISYYIYNIISFIFQIL